MEIASWLRLALHAVPTQLLETPLIIGLVLFAATWVHRHPWIALPRSARRRALLVGLGSFGPLAVVGVALITGAIAAFSGYDDTGVAGWWRRPAAMAAAALVIGIAAFMLSREPIPAPGDRVIAPRRRWWSFAPKTLLWLGGVAAVLLAVTSTWQGFTTTLLPAGGRLVGRPTPDGGLEIAPAASSEQGLPDGPFVDNPAGGGWLNNGVTLLALLALLAVLIVTLARDANRPLARNEVPSIAEARKATARLLVLLALGGVLITLGMLWMYVGYLGSWSVIVETATETSQSVPAGSTGFVGLRPEFAAFAEIFRYGGWLLQGLGVAILLRLACDTWRASRKASETTLAPAALSPISQASDDAEVAR